MWDQDDAIDTCEQCGELESSAIECPDCKGIFCSVCYDRHSCDQIEDE